MIERGGDDHRDHSKRERDWSFSLSHLQWLKKIKRRKVLERRNGMLHPSFLFSLTFRERFICFISRGVKKENRVRESVSQTWEKKREKWVQAHWEQIEIKGEQEKSRERNPCTRMESGDLLVDLEMEKCKTRREKKKRVTDMDRSTTTTIQHAKQGEGVDSIPWPVLNTWDEKEQATSAMLTDWHLKSEDTLTSWKSDEMNEMCGLFRFTSGWERWRRMVLV